MKIAIVGTVIFAAAMIALAAAQVGEASVGSGSHDVLASALVDEDGDGVDDASDLCPGTSSGDPVDENGCSDAQVDADGDGVCNAFAPSAGPSGCTGKDLCPTGTDPNDPVDVNGCSDAQVDADGDGICNSFAPSGGPSGCTGKDNCPLVPNPGQENADGDSVGDACDGDDDNDTVLDVVDNCPLTPNPGQQNSDSDAFGDACDTEGPPGNHGGAGGADDCSDGVDNDGDGFVDWADTGCPAPDGDGDGAPDSSDNCPLVPNPDQQDTDGDGLGDACDPDAGDGGDPPTDCSESADDCDPPHDGHSPGHGHVVCSGSNQAAQDRLADLKSQGRPVDRAMTATANCGGKNH